jgi:hypothetical protein
LKKIVCLANSRKHSGRCVAGKEVLAKGYGNWIRPVSARRSAEISEEERRYENGVLPEVLDIISIPMIGATPQLYQSENYVIDADSYWIKKGQASWPDIKELVDKPAPLWTSNDSTYYGLNDRVKVDLAAKLANSLMLIAPEDLTIKVVTEGGEFGNPRRRVRADFRLRFVHGKHGCVHRRPAHRRRSFAAGNVVGRTQSGNPKYGVCVGVGEGNTSLTCLCSSRGRRGLVRAGNRSGT